MRYDRSGIGCKALITTVIILTAERSTAQVYCQPSLAHGNLTSSCSAKLIDASQNIKNGKTIRNYEVKGSCKVGGNEKCWNFGDDPSKKSWVQAYNVTFVFSQAQLTWHEESETAYIKLTMLEKIQSKTPAYYFSDLLKADYHCVVDPFLAEEASIACKPKSLGPSSLGAGGDCPTGGDAICPPFAGSVLTAAAEEIIKKKLDAAKLLVAPQSTSVDQGSEIPLLVAPEKTPQKKLPKKKLTEEGTPLDPIWLNVPHGWLFILEPRSGAAYPSTDHVPVSMRVHMDEYEKVVAPNATGFIAQCTKAGPGTQPPKIIKLDKVLLTGIASGFADFGTSIPFEKFGQPGTWQCKVLPPLRGGAIAYFEKVAPEEVGFSIDQPDPITATGLAIGTPGRKFGSKVPQIAKGTGPVPGVGGPTLDGAVSAAGTSVPAVQTQPGSPDLGFNAGTMPTVDKPKLREPDSPLSTRTAKATADLEVIALSLDGDCNVWATLKNGGSAAISETVKESIALDGRNVLSTNAVVSLAPGQTLRRQVASYPQVKFAKAAVRYNMALDDANSKNNSIEKSLYCPKEQTVDAPSRTAPSPDIAPPAGFAPPPAGRTQPGR